MKKTRKNRRRLKQSEEDLMDRVGWLICRELIDIGRERAVPSPDINEIVHYAQCHRCRNEIEAQGWRVKFKRDKKGIYEVTFKATETEELSHLSGEHGHIKDEDEEDEDEELKVTRPERLVVGEERPKRPKTPEADFYVV